MPSRRRFLKGSALMLGAGLARNVRFLAGTASSDSGWCKTARLPRVEGVLNREALKPRGQFYQATVPDTLDLAERARLSVNVLTHNVDPQWSYYVSQRFDFTPKGIGPDPRYHEQPHRQEPAGAPLVADHVRQW